MKKIGILTFINAYNMGAVIQAFALQTFINSELQTKCDLIDYECEAIKKQYQIPNICSLFRRPKSFVSKTLSAVVFRKRYKRIYDFAHSLPLSPKCDGKNYKDVIQNYDMVIVGSDQVWNPNITNGDEVFLLKDIDAKKVAYAASVGISKLSNTQKEHFSHNLSSFSNISVREEVAHGILESIGVDSTVVCDPVFLLNRNIWDHIAIAPPLREYIFIYKINACEKIFKYALNLSKVTGCQVICYSNNIVRYSGIKMVYDVSPAEWLGWIKNARYIITNSFHATAFSIIFQKDFMVEILNRNNANSRVYQLLDIVDMKDRIMDLEVCTDSINYEKKYAKLDVLIAASKQFITDSIGK